MKKLILLLLVLGLVASPAFAAVGIQIANAPIGTATDINFPVGTAYSFDGSTFTIPTLTNNTGTLTSGTINGCTIGASSASTGKFTTLEATGATVIDSTLGVTGVTTLSGNAIFAGTIVGGGSSNIAINTNKFTVAASSGNTLVAGTLNVTGAVAHASTVANTGAVTNSSTVVGPGTGYGVYNLRKRVTTAQLNAGNTVLAAVTGRQYRLINCKMIAYGGSMAATANATGVAISGTESASGVALYTVNLAQLTRSAVNTIGTASTTVLADGASFIDTDAATAITIAAVGGTDLITATGVDVDITYAIE